MMKVCRMQYKAAIFDMDGLLIDSEPLWQEAGIETLSGFGIRLTLEQYHTSTGLRNSILAGDVNNAMIALTGFIRNLPSDEHSEINLDRLVASLNSNCSVVAEKLCFGCIMTLPEQSEIRIQFFDNGTVVKKTFDLSHPPGGNSMIVLNMHD